MKPTIPEEIFRIANALSFKEIALEIFRFQASECSVYRQFINPGYSFSAGYFLQRSPDHFRQRSA
jgi:hypothetical protein